MKILITGSNGLIGSEIAKFFLEKNNIVFGIDNNMRQKLFGVKASTNNNRLKLQKYKNYIHYSTDIRNKTQLEKLFKSNLFKLIVHCAGQPSHDKAKEIPLLDFDINTTGTLNLLELTRKYQKNAVFVFTSTNKVYGDNPNKIPLIEKKTRFVYKNKIKGIDETISIDRNTHSLMGSSKLAADIYTQEYGKYFKLKTTILRLGCVTGPSQTGVKLHGFLSFLVKSIMHDNKYEIIGYKGKQVRDQIDANDLAKAIFEIYKKPNYGEVFNLGGGPKNSASIIELINIISKRLKTNPKITYNPEARQGDHICYITDYTKFKKRYPNWKITKNINKIIDEIIEYENNNLS
jgi:CDP-paratose 2-epimerase